MQLARCRNMSLKFVRQNGAETLYTCPDCGKPKLNWNASRGLGRCFTCDKGYNTVTFQRLLGVELTLQPQVSWRRPKPSEGYVEAWGYPRCRAYMQGRGVGQEVTEACGALYADDQVHFPVWSPFEMPPMLMRRSILPGEKGWRSFAGHKGDYLFGKWPTNGTVILAEGTFDVLTPGLWGKAVATLGKTVSFDMAMWLASNSERLFVWFDPDAAGKMGALATALLLSTIWGKEVAVIQAKEPGSCTPQEAEEILKGAGYYV